MGKKLAVARRMGVWVLTIAMTLATVNIPVKGTEAAHLVRGRQNSISCPSGAMKWSGNSTGTSSVSDVSITRTTGDGTNQYYAEYSFHITNKSNSAITGIQILIPTSGEVSMSYTNGFTASYDAAQRGVVVYYSATLEAGQTVSSSDNKVGFSLNGATIGESYVIAVNCGGPDGSDLDYELTGLKNVPFSETPVGRHGKLSVSSATGYTAPVLTDETGTPVQLRGASTHGMHWFPDYVNKTAFQTLRDDWGINLVRLVCYPRDSGDVGYLTGGESTKNKLDTLIQNGVDYASELGMYALVDWHVHNYNPNEYINEAKEFFTKYATMYKDKDNVLYEICNEPTGTPWYTGSNDLYTYCKEIIKTIRAIDADAVIICGTNTWSQDVDEVAAHPMKELGYENIMYTFHFYAATHYGDLMNKVKTATAAGTPIFVTEFGVCSADGNGSYGTANATSWMELLDSLNISFACWSYSNCNEKSAYFTQSCSKKEGGWTSDDLTTTGKWLINTCRAREEKELGLLPSVKPTKKPTPTPAPQPTKEPQTATNVTLTYQIDGEAKTSTARQGALVTLLDAPKSGYKLVWHKDNAQGAVYQVGDTYLLEEDVVFIAEYIYIQNTDDQKGQNTDIRPTQKPSPVKVTGMKLTADMKNVKGYPVKTKVQLAPKKSMQLRVALLPANAKGQKLTFKSSNASIVKVTASGKLIAGKKPGKAVITIASQNGCQMRLTVQVMKKAVKKITLKASQKKIKVKKKWKLKATVSPGKTSACKALYWKSSNPRVATVTQDGVVRARKKGKVTITAYATDGTGKKKGVKLTIK